MEKGSERAAGGGSWGASGQSSNGGARVERTVSAGAHKRRSRQRRGLIVREEVTAEHRDV